MNDTLNLAFNSLNDEELYDLFRHPPSETNFSSHSPSYVSYENDIAQQFNLSSEELNYDFDSN